MINRLLYSKRVLVPTALLLMLIISGMSVTLDMPDTAATDSAQSTLKQDERRLIGRWARSDGGYVLELKEVGKDGALKAAYINPRPISIVRAELTRKDGMLTVFIELRDVNYPGSKYNLQYNPRLDRLIGTYFQAVENQTYDIEFVRIK